LNPCRANYANLGRVNSPISQPNGYRFKGGDPAKKANWEKVQGAGGSAGGIFPERRKELEEEYGLKK